MSASTRRLRSQDAKVNVHAGLVAYARSLDVWGLSGKVVAALPVAEAIGHRKGRGTGTGSPGVRARRPAAPRLRQCLWRSRALDGGIPDVPAGHHRRGQPAGDRSAWAVRLDQAAERRDQPLVLQAGARGVQGLGPPHTGADSRHHLLHQQRRLLRREDPRAGPHLLRAGPPDLRVLPRVLGRTQRHLLRRRAHDHRRREGRASWRTCVWA